MTTPLKMLEATSARRYFFVVGWTKGMALPAYIDGPFLNVADAKHASIDWLFSGRADAYSVMETVPQEAWPDANEPGPNTLTEAG